MLRMFQLIGDADDLLERSWRERNWGIFIRVWLMATFWVAVLAFLLPFIFGYIPAFLYNVVASVVAVIAGGAAKLVGLSFSEVLRTMAVPFCAMVGLFTLIFTVPVMLLKQLSDEFNAR
jgi:hypothetical protein